MRIIYKGETIDGKRCYSDEDGHPLAPFWWEGGFNFPKIPFFFFFFKKEIEGAKIEVGSGAIPGEQPRIHLRPCPRNMHATEGQYPLQFAAVLRIPRLWKTCVIGSGSRNNLWPRLTGG